MDAIDPAPGAAPAGSSSTPQPSWRISSVGSSGLTAASIVLLRLYITGRFLWQYNKEAAAAAAAASQAAPASSSRPASSAPPRPRRGVSLLPVSVRLGAAECAVCLAEFAQGEPGRALALALPRCGHAFHEECIVTWLRVNTTCPLCLAPVAAKN